MYILVVELPVFTGAVLAGCAYLYRQGRKNADSMWKFLRRLEIMFTKMSLTSDSTARDIIAMNTRLTSVEVRQATLSENNAVISSELENHQRWHERKLDNGR